jgi:hypothetical protein
MNKLYIAVGLPTLAVLTSLVISLVQIAGLREDMRAQNGALREDMRAQVGGLREDMRAQNGALREDVRTQVGGLREDIREMRSDIKLLTGIVYELMGQK